MYKIYMETNPSSKDLDLISKGLSEHAGIYVGNQDAFVGICVLMRDEIGKLVGGATGKVIWNWLYVSHLWVQIELRGRGYGKQIMECLEKSARVKGCNRAHLDTFSFQAKPFYESLGYRVFALLDDYPEGYCRYFMYKKL